MTLEAGARLGHYRIISLLGRGGMADVYRAEDERLGREVALKAVPPEFTRDPERVERFEREVRAAARLTHPNIVTVYEFGQGAGQHFYTMALMPGGDLKARIGAHPDWMPPSEARAVAAAMARALDYAHRQGFVHRDVKPENILFGEDASPQLTDFGIARAMSSGTRMTATGMSIGSPHYMSPEQARGQAVDGRSDLYSLGVVLYEMLTGRVPFDAADTLAVAYAHVNDPVPELPPAQQEWQPVVDRLLAKSPDDRFGNAGDLAKILASDAPAQAPATRVMPTGRDLGSPARPQEPATRLADAPNPQRKTLVAVAGGALLALAVVGIGYVALQDAGGPERQSSNGSGGSAAVRPAPAQPAPIPTLPSDPGNPFDVEDREEEPSNGGGADAEVRAPEPSPPPAPQPTPSPPPPPPQPEPVRTVPPSIPDRPVNVDGPESARQAPEDPAPQPPEPVRPAPPSPTPPPEPVRPAPPSPTPPPEPVRVGGNITQPTKVRDVPPVYPPVAQAARVQGVVILEAMIRETGRVTDVKVIRSVPLLDEAAITAVRQWEYTPTLVNGVPVPVIMTVAVGFALQ